MLTSVEGKSFNTKFINIIILIPGQHIPKVTLGFKRDIPMTLALFSLLHIPGSPLARALSIWTLRTFFFRKFSCRRRRDLRGSDPWVYGHRIRSLLVYLCKMRMTFPYSMWAGVRNSLGPIPSVADPFNLLKERNKTKDLSYEIGRHTRGKHALILDALTNLPLNAIAFALTMDQLCCCIASN